MTYQKLENVSTISWLMMDFCWMSDYMIAAWIFSFLAIGSAIGSILTHKRDGNMGEALLLYASFMWILMNSINLYGEDLHINWLVVISKILFVVTISMVGRAIYVSHREKEKLNFKRLKIK